MKLKWALTIIIVLIAGMLVNTLYVAGVFKTLHPHLEGSLQMMYNQMPGPEDMDVDYENGLLFISSTDRWKSMKGQSGDGAIWLLKLESSAEPVRLMNTYSGEFNPHGISLLKKDSNTWLFAVNHNASGNYVERFSYRNDTLFHEKTFAGDEMCCPNDVAAVDPDRFYVTNDHGLPKGFMRTLEDYLLLPFSSLLYFDGTSFSTVAKGLHYGNGVNVSKDGTTVFLAETTGRDIQVLRRDPQTGQLAPRYEIDLETGVDNIHIDDEDQLWVAAHPKMLAFAGHAKDPQKKSPSQVLKLTPSVDGYSITEVYLDDGNQLSGSSVAVPYKGDLFIGVVFEHKVLRLGLKR